MCDCFRDPSKPGEEITLEDIKKLPEMAFTNITGGEPFVRQDIPQIVEELYKKSDRIVISTNGYFTDRIIDLCKQFPRVGIRMIKSEEFRMDLTEDIKHLKLWLK